MSSIKRCVAIPFILSQPGKLYQLAGPRPGPSSDVLGMAYELTSRFSRGSQLNEVNFALFTPRFQTDCVSPWTVILSSLLNMLRISPTAHALSQFFESACSKDTATDRIISARGEYSS